VGLTNEYEAEDKVSRRINSGNYVYCLVQKLLSSHVGTIPDTDVLRHCTVISEPRRDENCGTKGLSVGFTCN
jgi:hypothetical protein